MRFAVDNCSFSRLSILYRAFIPADVPGVTKRIGNLSVIVAPGGNMYHTDQRTFSTDPNASARSISEINLYFHRDSGFYSYRHNSFCHATIQYDSNGRELKRATATPSVDLTPQENPGQLYLTLDATATNPLMAFGDFNVSWITPAISYKAFIWLRKSFLMVMCRHDSFPAYELLLQVDQQAPVMLHQGVPTNPYALAGVGLDNPNCFVSWFHKFPRTVFEPINVADQLRILRNFQ